MTIFNERISNRPMPMSSSDARLDAASSTEGITKTRLTRFWRRFVLKDLLLAWLIHPLEERFDRSDPLYVMLALRKRCDG
jgi:hypothetical protein